MVHEVVPRSFVRLVDLRPRVPGVGGVGQAIADLVRPTRTEEVLRRGPVLEREPHRLTLVEDEPRRHVMVVDVERKR